MPVMNNNSNYLQLFYFFQFKF